MATLQAYNNVVQELYIAYFGRPADFDGLTNFVMDLAIIKAPTDAAGLFADYASSPVKALVDAFGGSNESTMLYNSATTEGFVNAIFQNLFNRSANTEGLEFWSAAIDGGTVTRGEAALAIAAGAQTNTSAQGLLDAQSIANKVACANAFLADLGANGMDGFAVYSGPQPAALGRALIAGVDGSTTSAQYDIAAQALVNSLNAVTVGPVHAFTTGADTITGGTGYNIFDGILDNAAGVVAGGQVQTFNGGDSITGSGLGNTLNLTDFGLSGVMTVPTGITVSGITSLNISSLQGVAGDFSNWGPLNYFNINASSGNDDVTVAANSTVRVSDTAGSVAVHGGANVTVSTDAAHTIAITSAAAQFQATVGDSASSIVNVTAGASVKISAGAGADLITLGANAIGTVAFAAHTGADSVVLGASGSSLVRLIAVTGLNNAGGDTITFAGETASTLVGFKQVTQAEVAATGANPALLQSWVAAADGAAGSGVSGAAHTVTWFQYQGQTFVLESVAGQSADAGTMASGNTLVELTGTGYSFAHATGAGGSLHLLG